MRAAEAALASHFTRPWRFANNDDKVVDGVVYSLPFSNSHGSRCALLCRGVLASKDECFYPALATKLQRRPGQVQHVGLFDFSAHGGESADEFHYSYARIVSEILSAVRSLELDFGFEVTVLVGHSMAANAVLLYASLYSNVPHVVAVNPRYSLSIDEHVSKADLLELIRDGHMQLRLPHRPNEPVRISLEDYRQRLCTDMSVVRKIGQYVNPVWERVEEVHTLLVHQVSDDIPLHDAQALHQWMVSKQPLRAGEPMDARAQACTCTLPDAVLQSPLVIQQALFQPHLSKSTPHTFVPLPTADRLDPSLRTQLLVQTVCAWISEHSGRYNLCGILKEQRTLPTRSGMLDDGQAAEAAHTAASSQSHAEAEGKAEVDPEDEDETASSAQHAAALPSQVKKKARARPSEPLAFSSSSSSSCDGRSESESDSRLPLKRQRDSHVDSPQRALTTVTFQLCETCERANRQSWHRRHKRRSEADAAASEAER